MLTALSKSFRRIATKNTGVLASQTTSSFATSSKAKTSKKTKVTVTAGSLTINDLIKEAKCKFPFKDAVRSIPEDKYFSFEGLDEYSEHLAGAFIDMGFGKESRLAVLMGNTAENIITQLAAAKAGITIVAVNSSITQPKDLAYILQDSKALGLLYQPKIDGTNCSELVQQAIPNLSAVRGNEAFRFKEFPELMHVITTGFYARPGIQQFRHCYVDEMDNRVRNRREKEIDSNTPLVLSYTASTDGFSTPAKGKTMTHADMIKEVQSIEKTLNVTSSDSACVAKAQGGVSAGVLACLHQNAQIVIPSSDYDEAAANHAIAIEKCGIVGTDNFSFHRR